MSVKLEGISKACQRTDENHKHFHQNNNDPAKIQTRQFTDTSLRVLPPHKPVQYGQEYNIVMNHSETGYEDRNWRKVPRGYAQMDSCCEHGNKPKYSITQGCQVTRLTKVCNVAPIISVLSVELLHVSLLVPRIWKWHLHFWHICELS
jgi:hypothetical protein